MEVSTVCQQCMGHCTKYTEIANLHKSILVKNLTKLLKRLTQFETVEISEMVYYLL